MTYDLCQDEYDGRVTDVMTLKCLSCQNCYYEPLDDDKIYKVVLPSFVGNGGDGYGVVVDQGQNYKIGKALLSDISKTKVSWESRMNS